MFSNRFLIKTMQMVGATRWFIAKPLNIKAIINGSISGIIASVLLYILILVAEGQIEWLKTMFGMLLLLFFILIVIGIGITLFSTNRSVVKYLRMSWMMTCINRSAFAKIPILHDQNRKK